MIRVSKRNASLGGCNFVKYLFDAFVIIYDDSKTRCLAYLRRVTLFLDKIIEK